MFGRFFDVDPVEMFEPAAYARPGAPRDAAPDIRWTTEYARRIRLRVVRLAAVAGQVRGARGGAQPHALRLDADQGMTRGRVD